jgi:hypothetical protein
VLRILARWATSQCIVSPALNLYCSVYFWPLLAGFSSASAAGTKETKAIHAANKMRDMRISLSDDFFSRCKGP